MARGKGGKLGKKGDTIGPQEIKRGHFFTASTLVVEAPKPPKAKKKTGKNVQEKEEPKTCYTTWDDEIYVASADGIAPGKMIMVGEEALQVLEVEGGKSSKKDGAKLVVKRACLGTLPKEHKFKTNVFVMPNLLSSRPGTSPAPIMRKDPTEGADAHAALLQKQKFANAYRAFLAGEANPYNAMLAENTSGSLLTRVESVLPMSPKRTVGGGVVKFQRAASLVSRVLSVAKGTAREDVGESESGVCGGRGELVCPIRVTRWFSQHRADLSGGLLLRPKIHRDDSGASNEVTASQDVTEEGVTEGSGWKPVFPYSTGIQDAMQKLPHAMQTLDVPEKALDIRRDALRRPQTTFQTTRAGGVLAIQQEQMFMYAVKHGHLGTVEQLLCNGVVHANMLCQEARAQQSCASDRDSTTILMLAAREGHADVVRLLLSYNADLLAKTHDGQTALMMAKDRLEELCRIVAQKREQAAAAAEAAAAAAAAAAEARAQTMAKLGVRRTSSILTRTLSMSNSADVETEEGGGLVKAVAEEEQKKVDRFQAVLETLRLGYVETVLRGGLASDVETERFLKNQMLQLGIQENWFDLVEALLDSGMSANHTFAMRRHGAADAAGISSVPAVQLAGSLGFDALVEFLLARRGSALVSDVDGYTPLMEIARSGNARCAQLLIAAGSKLEDRGPEGTAAHLAVATSNAEVLQVLLKAGARIGEKNAFGQDCLLQAWTNVHGAAGKGDNSRAGATLEVLRSFFQNLATKGRGGTCDAYCSISVATSATGPWYPGLKSAICRNTTSPQFNEVLEQSNPFSLESGIDLGMPGTTVKIEVWDSDQVGDELLIGDFTVDLKMMSSQPCSTVAGAFTLHASLEPKAQHERARSAAHAEFRGILNVKLQISSQNSLVVHLEQAEALVPQSRTYKEMGDCLKSAAIVGWCDVIETCMRVRQADVNTLIDGHRRRLPLMYAAATQQPDVVKLLLEFKADPNLGDSEGVTALMWACAGRVLCPHSSKPRVDLNNLEAALVQKDQNERQLCKLRLKYAVSEFFEGNLNVDSRLLSESMEFKEPHDQLRRKLTEENPTADFARYATVDLLLRHGANPLVQDEAGRAAVQYIQADMDEDVFLRLEWLWR